MDMPHGTADDAVDFVLNSPQVMAPGEETEFLRAWREGDLEEWPEFHAWLAEREGGASEPEMIEIGGRTYRKFIRYPGPVTDGTARCFRCGQIDEPEYHDDSLCRQPLPGDGEGKS